MPIKKTSLLGSVLLLLGIYFVPSSVLARENVTDWYVQNFDSSIVVNKDSSLDITEMITADCGNAVDKHGIFRILPESIKVEGGETIKTPVELVSITDFSDKSIPFTESKSSTDDTVTWKIGDPNKTVQGVNYYKIHYRVKNAIRFGNPNFDEFYWNLSGNFWDLEIDKFHGKITFPEEVTKDNSTLNYYTGKVGDKGNSLATFSWSAPNVLETETNDTLFPGEGVTASVTFPKNIFTPYVPSFWETYGGYFFFLIPLAVFLFCFNSWKKHGKDPRVDKTVIAEYAAPGNLTPIELGVLMTSGRFKSIFITAEIINLATKKLITIKELDKKILFFHHKDYEFTKNPDPEIEKTLNAPQKTIFDKLFEEGDVIELSSLRNKFYKVVTDVDKKTTKLLEDKKLISPSGIIYQISFLVVGMIAIIGGLMLVNVSGYLGASVVLSGVIFLAFSFIMPKRTPEGAELNWQIKGFKLFMETVDKHRAEFYEKENIFEKFLPYAIVFGITKIWINKMKEVYGEDFYARNTFAWYVGSSAFFDADSFSSSMDSLSSSIAANTSSPSGSGGAGGAGGGGGGGGGGGW